MTRQKEIEAVHGRDPIQADLPWLQAAHQGDVSAWEHLVQRYQQPVFRLAYLILGNSEDAEEVAQDVFVRAYKSLASFDVSRPLQPWLLQITRNLARNKYRSLKRYLTAVQRWRQTEPDPPPADAAHQENARLLWQAVRRLRPSAQEIIYLRYFLELTEAETAEALAVKPGTVKSRLSRARTQLRDIIETDFPELAQ